MGKETKETKQTSIETFQVLIWFQPSQLMGGPEGSDQSRTRRVRAYLFTYYSIVLLLDRNDNQTSIDIWYFHPNGRIRRIRPINPSKHQSFLLNRSDTKFILTTNKSFWDNFVLRAGTGTVPREQNYPHRMSFFIFSSDTILIILFFPPYSSIAMMTPSKYGVILTYFERE